MLQVIVKLPDGTFSIKDKRRVMKSLKERIRNKFQVSAAEVDLNDSISFGQLGMALVTNSRQHGNSVMRKILLFLDDESVIELHHSEILVEEFGN